MRSRPFASADPFLKLILLFLLSFVSLSLFMLMAQGITSSVWGIAFFADPGVAQDFSKPHTVYVNWVLLFFQHLGLFIVPAMLFALLSHPQPRVALGFHRVSPSILAMGVLIMVAAIPLVNALSWLNQLMSLPEVFAGLERVLQDMERQAQVLTDALTSTGDWRYLLVNLVVLAAIPAIGEELIFRGLVLRILESWTGKTHRAVWVSAILFSAMHMQFYGFVPRMVLGALLGYLFVWTRSIWVPIVAHFTNNALALVVMYFIARQDLPQELDGFEPTVVDLSILGLSIVLVGGLAWKIHRYGNSRKGLEES